MFAVFEDGSHQFRVQAGDTLWVDFREGAETGSTLTFDRVLAAGTDSQSAIGRPLLSNEDLAVESLAAGPWLGGSYPASPDRHWQPGSCLKWCRYTTDFPVYR